MQHLRQSTAGQEVFLGPFLDDIDGKTAETALIIANTDIAILKAGATAEVAKNAGGATHLASGRYYAVFDATDTDTIGPGEANIHVAGALPVKVRFSVLSAAVYDWLYGATAPNVTAPLDAVGVRTAVGMAIADLDAQLAAIDSDIAIVDDLIDTEVAAIKAKTDLIPAAPAAVGDIPTAAANAGALLDLADGVEAGLTFRQWLRLGGSVLFGKSSNGGGTFRDFGDTKARITASVDAAGNRTLVTRDAT